ncbi:MAG: VWA domain-containing protein [Acidobacteria bacterium]|nr:VWA domain-containing protein [Acidobacteriota bacterium]
MNRVRSTVLFTLLGSLCLAPSIARAQSDERIIYASVVGDKGAPVMGLGVNDFIVREDRVAREILRVSPDRAPMQVALLVDDSRLMRGREGLLRQAVSAFVTNMRPDVMIALIGLGERPTIRSDYTRDREKLLTAIGSLFGHGSHTLSDAIFESSAALAKRPLMRSVIVAITSSGRAGGYRHRIEVLEALQWSQATLHVITVSDKGGASGRLIQEATQKTGGRDDTIIGMIGLERKAVDLAAELSNQYRVTYARPQRLIPPKKTEIRARNPELHARGMLVMTDTERERLRFAWAKR